MRPRKRIVGRRTHTPWQSSGFLGEWPGIRIFDPKYLNKYSGLTFRMVLLDFDPKRAHGFVEKKPRSVGGQQSM